jgi:hypothetical protein
MSVYVVNIVELEHVFIDLPSQDKPGVWVFDKFDDALAKANQLVDKFYSPKPDFEITDRNDDPLGAGETPYAFISGVYTGQDGPMTFSINISQHTIN